MFLSEKTHTRAGTDAVDVSRIDRFKKLSFEEAFEQLEVLDSKMSLGTTTFTEITQQMFHWRSDSVRRDQSTTKYDMESQRIAIFLKI